MPDDECLETSVLPVVAAHRLCVDRQREGRVGVAHLRHDHGRRLAERVQEWIAAEVPDTAPWAPMGLDVWIEMPRVRPPDLDQARTVAGRRDSGQLAWAAVLKDYAGLTYGRVARDPKVMLATDDGDSWRSRGAQRYVRAGRELLGARGVAPWAAWPKGKVSNNWWLDEPFLSALEQWADSAQLKALDAARPVVTLLARAAERFEGFQDGREQAWNQPNVPRGESR